MENEVVRTNAKIKKLDRRSNNRVTYVKEMTETLIKGTVHMRAAKERSFEMFLRRHSGFRRIGNKEVTDYTILGDGDGKSKS